MSMKQKILIGLTFLCILGFGIKGFSDKYAGGLSEIKNEIAAHPNLFEDTEEDEEDTGNVVCGDYTYADSIYIDYIDVGQGDSTLVYGNGEAVLIDTGDYYSYDAVKEALEKYNVTTIDALILTHPDSDHIGNASSIIEDYTVATLYMPFADNDTKTYDKLLDTIDEHNIVVNHPTAGEYLYVSDAEYQFLGPLDCYEDSNSNSLVIRMTYGDDSFLWCGDATGEETKDILAAGYKVSADVYKVSHHGSANDGCNSESWYKSVHPSYAIVSCELYNSHGHPHIETMDMIKNSNCKLYRTDMQGSIFCEATGGGIKFEEKPCEDFRNGNSIKE